MSDFSFALLLVTFEFLEVEKIYIPLMKDLICGINAVEAQGCGCMFTLCHDYLKMGVLLHKMAIVCNQTLLALYRIELCWNLGGQQTFTPVPFSINAYTISHFIRN